MNVAVNTSGFAVTANPDSVPFPTVTSSAAKSTPPSENVNVTVAVSPAFNAESSSATVTVGATVSMPTESLPVTPTFLAASA